MRRTENGRDTRRFRRDEDDSRRVCNPMFIIMLAIKIMLLILSIVVLVLVAEYNTSWMIIFIIAVAACTLLYVAVSVMVEFFIMCICPTQNDTCHVAEVVCTFMFTCVWLISCGIAAQVSLSAGSRTTELFGWVGACTGVGTALFLATAILYCVQIIPVVRYGKL